MTSAWVQATDIWKVVSSYKSIVNININTVILLTSVGLDVLTLRTPLSGPCGDQTATLDPHF